VPLLFCSGLFFSSFGGQTVHGIFSGGPPSDSLVIADSLVLAVARTNVLCQAFGPLLTNPTGTKSHVPDVYSPVNDRFRFFWSDTMLSGSFNAEKMFRRDMSVLPAIVDTSAPPVAVYPFDTVPINYLHVAQGGGHFFGSFIQNVRDLSGFGDVGQPKSGIVTATMQGASACYYKGNSFLVAYVKNSSVVACKQITFAGNAFGVSAFEDTLAKDSTSSLSWINPSLAADSGGNVCALWMRGNSVSAIKKIVYGVYDSLLNVVKVDSFSDNISGPGLPNYYDNAPVISYGRNKFAAASWDLGGITLRLFNLTGPAHVDTSTIRIKSAANCRYPAISSNGNAVLISWMNYSVDKKSVHIRCMQYPLIGGAINTGSPSAELAVSDTTFGTGILDTTKVFTLRCAMDSTGNLAFCWNLHDCAHAVILANRTLVRKSGSWTSPKDSLPIFQGDSASFFKGSVALDPASITASSQDTLDSLFLSVDNGSSWTFFKNNVASLQEVKGPYKYFNYKVTLKCIDSITTPAVKTVAIQWKVKPRLLPLDSVKINGTLQTGRRFGDTLRCFSRCDSVRCRFGLAALDTLDTIYTASVRNGKTAADSVNRSKGWFVSDTIYPLTKTDTIAWRFTATSKAGWAAQDSSIYILTHNAIPRLSLQVSLDGAAPVAVVGQTRINVQQTDSLDFTYSIQDSNDAGTLVRAYLDNVAIDSAGQNVIGHYRFRCVRGLPQGDVFRFTGKDPDDSAVAVAFCGVNHFPTMDSVFVKGTRIRSGDTARVDIGSATPIVMHGSDLDVGYGDTVRFTIRRPGLADSVQKDPVFTWFPRVSDSLVCLYITDKAGKSDSLKFFIKYPQYAADSSSDPGLVSAKKILRDSVALIIGGSVRDTIGIPIKNTGTDTLTVLSLQFKGTAGGWLSLLVPQSNSVTAFDSLGPSTMTPIQVAPGNEVNVSAILFADSLKGDHMAYDTLIIGTNDGRHAFDTLPIRLKYNDLPRILSMSFNFALNQPYWLSKSKATKKTSYVFPPYAKITMRFSEPVDSASAAQAIRIYSLFDSLINPGGPPIPLTYQWGVGKTQLDVSPNYTQASPYFKIKPPPGFFIPTDKLKMIVSSSLTDTAKPPNGPNAMDVHQIYAVSPPSDTMFIFNVDSVHYTITAVSPDSASLGAALKPLIAVTFSSPPFPGTIDTNKVRNKTLVVGSTYSGANQISFDSVYVIGSTAYFSPAKKFFYGDTVRLWYRGLWARDSLGYSVDLNGDGIPSSMFDTSSTADDKRWYFTVKNISPLSSYPPSGAAGVPIDTAVTLSFSDSVNASIVDTSKTGNRSFQAFSRCGGKAPLPIGSIKIAGTRVFVRFAHRLYYGDSVSCQYDGLSTADSAHFSIGGLSGATLFTKNTLWWSYKIRDINLLSAVPDSAAPSSTMHPEIALTFSEPVYTGLFDFDTSANNRSIQITSPYTKDSTQAFKTIAVSADSTRIVITPKTAFFSNDSVHCSFKGLAKNFVYGQADNVPRDTQPVICARDWYFFIQTQEFYTYPNPYKPGSNPRHCSANGPCGIIFKNLHVLKKGLSEVSIKIFTMSAFPIYSTQTAGLRVKFQAGNSDLKPEWKWDTRNQHGEFVASGLYFYAVYDPAGEMLIKGKLMIVR